jgi:hypothetical protein
VFVEGQVFRKGGAVGLLVREYQSCSERQGKTERRECVHLQFNLEVQTTRPFTAGSGMACLLYCTQTGNFMEPLSGEMRGLGICPWSEFASKSPMSSCRSVIESLSVYFLTSLASG